LPGTKRSNVQGRLSCSLCEKRMFSFEFRVSS
jgi:hypothetical protein